MKQLLHDNSLLLSVSHSSGTSNTNLHGFKEFFNNSKVWTTSPWVAHYQSPLFGVNYFQVVETG